MHARTAAIAILLALLGPAHARASDLVVAPQGHARGTILFIHGGAWAGGKPESELGNARAFAARGWRGVAVDYPLRDIAAAYRSVEDHAKRLAGAGPVIAIGDSVGGTMTEWLAARREVDAAVAIDAPADLVAWRAVRPGAPLAWIPEYVTGFSELRWKLSPARVYRSGSAAPLLVFGARNDRLVEHKQSLVMKRLGAELKWMPGDHLASRRWRRPAADFLRRVTRR